MERTPKTFYRYRNFSTATLEMLCFDRLYFANPGSFNDPMDCNPSLKCDSSNEDLRKLLRVLLQKRVAAEVLSHLKDARVKDHDITGHAQRRAVREAEHELDRIAYHATNPDYEREVEVNESWLLVNAIENELHRSYGRGICCFSTSYSNPLLWSHYGDQHNGICIGYTANRNPVPRLQKVIYGGSRAISTSALVDVYLNESKEAATILEQDVLLRKAGGWRYEREWRLVGEQGPQDSPLLLTEITFGLRCSISVMHAVVAALAGREKKVKFYEMHEVNGSYALRRRLLDIAELSSSLPCTAWSGLEVFGPYEH